MFESALRQNGWRLTFSMGAVTFITPPATLQEMIKRADEVMFSVKSSGKNRLQQEVWG
jgi:PleD family two-component response regulator